MRAHRPQTPSPMCQLPPSVPAALPRLRSSVHTHRSLLLIRSVDTTVLSSLRRVIFVVMMAESHPCAAMPSGRDCRDAEGRVLLAQLAEGNAPPGVPCSAAVIAPLLLKVEQHFWQCSGRRPDR